MKKIFTVVTCLLLICTSFIFAGCGSKVQDIETKYPESFKVVTESVNTASDTYIEDTTTYIQGKYNNRAVIYMKEVTVIDHGEPTVSEYLWIANDNSTKATELLEDIIYRDFNLGDFTTQYDYDGPTAYTLSNYLQDIKATGSYNDRNLVSSSATELVYRFDQSDTIYISNDEYHLTNRRVQTYREWTNTYSIGDFTSSIPHIADILSE